MQLKPTHDSINGAGLQPYLNTKSRMWDSEPSSGNSEIRSGRREIIYVNPSVNFFMSTSYVNKITYLLNASKILYASIIF